MKWFFALTFAFALIYGCYSSPSSNENVSNTTIMEFCTKEAGVTKEEVEEFSDSDEASEDLNCYFYCVFTQAGYIDGEGVIQVEKFESDNDMPDMDIECVKKVPKLLECNDIKQLEDCKV